MASHIEHDVTKYEGIAGRVVSDNNTQVTPSLQTKRPVSTSNSYPTTPAAVISPSDNQQRTQEPSDDRASLFSEPHADGDTRRLFFDELSYSSIPGNLHLTSDEAIERFVDRYGMLSVIRQLATDLAEREAEVGLLRRQKEDRERELKKMLVQCGVSLSEVDKRLMNMTATSIRKPDSVINELMDEAIQTSLEDEVKEMDIAYQKPERRKSWSSSRGKDASPTRSDHTDDNIEPQSIESHKSMTSLHEQEHETRSRAMSSISVAPVELNDIVPLHIQPPTLLQSKINYGAEESVLTDRFGFIYDRNKHSNTNLSQLREKGNDTQITANKPAEIKEEDDDARATVWVIDNDKGLQLHSSNDTPQIQTTYHNEELKNTSIESVLHSEANNSSSRTGSSVRMLLSQLTEIHDGLQKVQTTRWDEFLRKINSGSEKKFMDIIQSGQLLGINGAELLSSSRRLGENGKGLWREFKELVYKGVPIAYRPKIWGECSGAWTLKTPGTYESLIKDETETDAMSQIELDLYRTMPYNVFFGGKGPGVDKLRRVLIAFSRMNPDVGYCQGMNVIAAILLLTYATEEDAFWSLVSLIENILPAGYFSPPLLTSRAVQRVFNIYFKQLLPRLQTHFQQLNVEVDAITFDWFLSCFTDALPPEVLFRVWDVFLCVEGEVYLFKIALALFKMYEKKLLDVHSGIEVYSFMKNLALQPIRIEEVMHHTSSYSSLVTSADVKRLRTREAKILTKQMNLTT